MSLPASLLATTYRDTIDAALVAADEAHARGQHANAEAFEQTAANNAALLGSLTDAARARVACGVSNTVARSYAMATQPPPAGEPTGWAPPCCRAGAA